MFKIFGGPSVSKQTWFISKSTGRSYSDSLMGLQGIRPKRNPNINIKLGFDYRSLINASRKGGPSRGQVAGFMSKETGCSYKSALYKLNMLKVPYMKKPYRKRPFKKFF